MNGNPAGWTHCHLNWCDYTVDSCWTGLSKAQMRMSCDWKLHMNIEKGIHGIPSRHDGTVYDDADECAEEEYTFLMKYRPLQAPGLCTRCHDPSFEHFQAIELAGNLNEWPFHMAGHQMAGLCTDCQYPNALQQRGSTPYSGMCVTFNGINGGMGRVAQFPLIQNGAGHLGLTSSFFDPVYPKFITKLGSTRIGEGQNLHGLGHYAGACWVHKQVTCHKAGKNVECDVKKISKCMGVCFATWHGAAGFKVASDCAAQGGTARNDGEIPDTFEPASAYSVYDVSPHNQGHNQARVPNNANFEESMKMSGGAWRRDWCCFEECSKALQLAGAHKIREMLKQESFTFGEKLCQAVVTAL